MEDEEVLIINNFCSLW